MFERFDFNKALSRGGFNIESVLGNSLDFLFFFSSAVSLQPGAQNSLGIIQPLPLMSLIENEERARAVSEKSSIDFQLYYQRIRLKTAY